ncbi:hypothetical protein OPTIMUS_72 [Mycobacterium phage Optimus]|uniref:Uncharacterized protein n=1 Tax=Mycobacterium phage Optimus TaxID=2922218 RepID=G1DAL1_9CAUD|nr:hypothetical protein FDG54_gp072 [Mycobacterium phage Optimus]AEJ92293.1 hypothetical protein OPTIMUS_72 [Mycobacterium phage Optimus]
MNDILKEIMTELDKLWNAEMDKAESTCDAGAFELSRNHSSRAHGIHLAEQIVRTAFFKRGYVVSDE